MSAPTCERSARAGRALVLFFVLFAPLRVHADEAGPPRVLLLAPSRVEDLERWTQVVRGLRAAGVRALQVADLPLDPVLAACHAAECAQRAAQDAQLPAIMVFVRAGDRGDRGGAPNRVEMQRYDVDGRQASLQVEFGPGSLAAAVQELFAAISLQLRLGDRALLRVDSQPYGALVTLDDEPVGVTPFEQPVAAGRHRLKVTLEGFAGVERDVALERAEQRDLTLRLPRVLDRPRELSGSTASPLNFIAGSVFALAALPLAIAGANDALNRGQCLASDALGCERRARFGVQSALELAGSGVALGLATFFFWAQPLRIEPEVAPRAGGLRMRGSF